MTLILPEKSTQNQPPERMGCSECLSGGGLDFGISMAFQPIVDITSKSVYSYEALVRGPSGESAGSVLGNVDDRNRYRFDQVCRVKAIELAARLGITQYLNINFLPNAVYNPLTCIQTTLEASREFSLPASRLIFEITEGEKIQNSAHVLDIIDEYKKMGFQTAIDDFGAGYSGLNLLTEFQPDLIKLDIGLIAEIDGDRKKQIILKSILAACRELDIRVIAEGIETVAEANVLIDSGVQYFQGYLFARPGFQSLPVPDFSALN